MEKDKAKPDDITDYYGGIVHAESGANDADCIIEYFIDWHSCFWRGGIVPCRLSVSVSHGRRYIAENETEYEVAKDLARKDLIADRFSFYLRMRLEKSDDVSLQSGSYTLNSSMTYDDIRHAIYRKKTDTLK